jgi:hypothetical protein
VEEKVVERAYLKLKLDAVVVQSGRLADKQKGLSKEEMQAMISFGADAVFKTASGGAGAGAGAGENLSLSRAASRLCALGIRIAVAAMLHSPVISAFADFWGEQGAFRAASILSLPLNKPASP